MARARGPCVVIQGMGELGLVFGQGFLRLGSPVVPVTRPQRLREVVEDLEPALLMCCVGEADLRGALAEIPAPLLPRTLLVQNELSDADVSDAGVGGAVVVWFEKKPGRVAKSIVPSLVWGHAAERVVRALNAVELPATVLSSRVALESALALKNLYILVTNLAGLSVGGTVDELRREHPELLRGLGLELLHLEAARLGRPLDAEALLQELPRLFDADPGHQCRGRSAPARLARALERADRLGVAVPLLRGLT